MNAGIACEGGQVCTCTRPWHKTTQLISGPHLGKGEGVPLNEHVHHILQGDPLRLATHHLEELGNCTPIPHPLSLIAFPVES